jgi:NADH:ubiquinone oxidoreductase subunit 4 (subunit M)
LTDATWNEKLASVILIVAIVIIGTMPFWISDLIAKTTETLFSAVIK